MILKDQVVLITGGTGSFGRKFTRIVLEHHAPKKLIIFSRDELKQFEMKQELGERPNVRYFLGDIRDSERLHQAFHGVDIVVHAAALKQVPALEYNPFEAIKTNVIGAENIITAAINQKVKKVVALSTDKAVNPINLYGATKLCAEKLFVAGNSYSGDIKTRFSIVRYGNVVGSRGSVIPFFLEKKKSGVLPITDERMSRFWITLNQGVDLVLTALERMHGGEIFIPKIPSMNIMDLAKAIAPDCKTKMVGVRPGEKISEVLLTEDEARHALEFKDLYVIQPDHPFWDREGGLHAGGKPLSAEFRYASDTNDWWLKPEEILAILEKEARATGSVENGPQRSAARETSPIK